MKLAHCSRVFSLSSNNREPNTPIILDCISGIKMTLYAITTNAVVLNAYQERDKSLLLVLLYGLFQSVSSQGEMLIGGQKPDLDQGDQTCFFKRGMSL